MRHKVPLAEDEFESSLGPMVDMVFLLLTFFLFTFQMKLEELNYPIETTVSKTQSAIDVRPINIELSAAPDGRLGKATVDGEAAASIDVLGRMLREKIGARAEGNRQARITPAQNLRYESVVQTVVVARNAGWNIYLVGEDYPREQKP